MRRLFFISVFLPVVIQAGPLTREDLAFMDVPPQELHDKITELRKKGMKTILDVGGSSIDLTDHIYYGYVSPDPAQDNAKAALQQIMGDWNIPEQYGDLGPFIPNTPDINIQNSLYHRLMRTDGGLMGYLDPQNRFPGTTIHDKIVFLMEALDTQRDEGLCGAAERIAEKIGYSGIIDNSIPGRFAAALGEIVNRTEDTLEESLNYGAPGTYGIKEALGPQYWQEGEALLNMIMGSAPGKSIWEDLNYYFEPVIGENLNVYVMIHGGDTGKRCLLSDLGNYMPLEGDSVSTRIGDLTLPEWSFDSPYSKTSPGIMTQYGIFGDLGFNILAGDASIKRRLGGSFVSGNVVRGLLQYLGSVSDWAAIPAPADYRNAEQIVKAIGGISEDPGVLGNFETLTHSDYCSGILGAIGDRATPTGIGDFKGVLGTLSGSAYDNVYESLDNVFTLLNAKTNMLVKSWDNSRPDLYSWINSFTDSPNPPNEVVSFLHYGMPPGTTNTDALQTVMGDWNTPTYGVVGAYVPSNTPPINDSLYHRICTTTKPMWALSGAAPYFPTDLAQKGIFGSLDPENFYWPTLSETDPNYSVSYKLMRSMFVLGTNADFSGVNGKGLGDLLARIGGGWVDGAGHLAHAGVIGDYTAGITHTNYYSGILGALADPEAGRGVMGDLGIFGTDNAPLTTIKASITDRTVPTDTEFPGGILGTLVGAASDYDNVYDALVGVFNALDEKVDCTVKVWDASKPDLLSWINGFTPGPGEGIVPYLHYGMPPGTTNTDALQTVMGDWNTPTYGVVGAYVPSTPPINDSLYHRITTTSVPTWRYADEKPTAIMQKGIFGSLDPNNAKWPAPLGEIDNVAYKIERLLLALGSDGNYSTPGNEKGVSDLITRIEAAIGGSFTPTSNYSGILGAIKGNTYPTANPDAGLFGMLGYDPVEHSSLYTQIQHLMGQLTPPPPPLLRAGPPMAGSYTARDVINDLLQSLGFDPETCPSISQQIQQTIVSLTGDPASTSVQEAIAQTGTLTGYTGYPSIDDQIQAAINDINPGQSTLYDAIHSADPDLENCVKAVGIGYGSGSALIDMISRPTFGQGVWGDLGYSTVTSTTDPSIYRMIHSSGSWGSCLLDDLGDFTPTTMSIKNIITDTTPPSGSGATMTMTGILGALDASAASVSEAIKNVFAEFESCIGIPRLAEEDLKSWIRRCQP